MRYLNNLIFGIVLTAACFHANANQAAFDLLEANGTKQYFTQNAGEMVEVVLRNQPELERHIEIVKQWEQQYYSWSAMKQTLAPIYTEHFSNEELIEISRYFKNGRKGDFLTTPTGLKYKRKVPRINQKLKSVAYQYYKDVVLHLDDMIAASTN